MREKYQEYEKLRVEGLRQQIAKVPEVEEPNTLRKQVFEDYLDKIYMRSK